MKKRYLKKAATLGRGAYLVTAVDPTEGTVDLEFIPYRRTNEKNAKARQQKQDENLSRSYLENYPLPQKEKEA